MQVWAAPPVLGLRCAALVPPAPRLRCQTTAHLHRLQRQSTAELICVCHPLSCCTAEQTDCKLEVLPISSRTLTCLLALARLRCIC